jgi:hypothetical protein
MINSEAKGAATAAAAATKVRSNQRLNGFSPGDLCSVQRAVLLKLRIASLIGEQLLVQQLLFVFAAECSLQS